MTLRGLLQHATPECTWEMETHADFITEAMKIEIHRSASISGSKGTQSLSPPVNLHP